MFDGGIRNGGEQGPAIGPAPVAITTLQSIDGVPGNPNFEAIVRVRSPMVIEQSSDTFEALWFDPAAGSWGNAGVSR
jgi:hypothetical protein